MITEKVNRNQIKSRIGVIMCLILLTVVQVSSAETEELTLNAGTTSSFDPMNLFKYRPWNGVNYLGFTHVGLVRYDEHLNILPCLAKDWKISEDGKSITFHLVDNATWHDGKPVTAEDVKFTFDYNMKHSLGISYVYKNNYDHVDVQDDHTVTLFASGPMGMTLLSSLHSAYIIPKHIWEKVDDPKNYDGKEGMIGCGPFVFEKYDPVAGEARFKANSNFFLGKPSIDAVEYKYYRTVDSMLLALKKGDIDTTFDYYMPISGVYAATLAGTDDINLGAVPDAGVELMLVFGYDRFLKLMNESQFKAFREAVSYTIDYQKIVDMISAGYGEVPGQGYIPPTALGYNSDIPKLEYNLTRAEEVLKELGFVDTNGDGTRNLPDGSELSITISAPKWKQESFRAAEVICNQLKDAGIDAKIDTEVMSNEDKWNQRIYKDKDYDICVSYATPSGILYDAGGVYCANMEGASGSCSDPELIELIKNVKYSKDREAREKAVYELQQYYRDNLPMIALVWAKALYPYRTDRFTGWVNQDGFGNMNINTWLSLKAEA